MQTRRRQLGDGVALAAWLMLAMLVGCSGGNSKSTQRNIGSADAASDAARDEVDRDAEEEGDEEAFGHDAAQDAAHEQTDTGMVAQMDAAPVELDAGLDATPPVDEAGRADAQTAEADASSLDASEAALEDAAAALEDAAPEAAVSVGATQPKGYLKPEDSPFAAVAFDYFYLEDFEDHTLSTLGLNSVAQPGSSTPAGYLSSSFGSGLIDSVDADDGTPSDNRCIKQDGYCDAWWGPGSLTFSFDAQLLGSLPTHVGGVWTDGEGLVSFEAFGPDGSSVYKVGPLSEPGFPDNTVNSSTSEDRFFGAYHPAGISAFTISNTAGGVEVDHVQYGRAR